MSGKGYAFTTDSYVVKPYFFPGGDIGKLAVCGTVNDLAMQGAQPYWLSLSFILEEGLPLAALRKIVQSIGRHGARGRRGDRHGRHEGRRARQMRRTLHQHRRLGPHSDAKLVGRSAVKAGDAVLLNGFLGEHGIAVMSQREGIAFSTSVVSDCAPLWPLVKTILDTGVEIHAMRDLTRGGLAAAVCDIAASRGSRNPAGRSGVADWPRGARRLRFARARSVGDCQRGQVHRVLPRCGRRARAGGDETASARQGSENHR